MTEQVATLNQRASIIKPKLRACAIHLAISAVIFLCALYIIVYEWYPFPHFWIDGGWEGVQIMIGVDMVLGPLLTLIIFNPRKPAREILMDLGIIGIVQTGALVWGFYAVHSQRPVVIVEWQGNLYSLTAESFEKQGINLEELRRLSHLTPPLVYAVQPSSSEEQADSMLLTFNHDLHDMEKFMLYRPFRDHLDTSIADAVDIGQITEINSDLKNELSRFLSREGSTIDNFVFKQIEGRYKKAVLILTRQGDIAGVLYTPMFRLE